MKYRMFRVTLEVRVMGATKSNAIWNWVTLFTTASA